MLPFFVHRRADLSARDCDGNEVNDGVDDRSRAHKHAAQTATVNKRIAVFATARVRRGPPYGNGQIHMAHIRLSSCKCNRKKQTEVRMGTELQATLSVKPRNCNGEQSSPQTDDCDRENRIACAAVRAAPTKTKT